MLSLQSHGPLSPSEFKHNGVDMDTFCDAIHRLNINGRPIYAKEAHHLDK